MHKTRALKSGPHPDPYCELGQLANGRNLEHLRVLLQDALDRRALLLTGGFPAHVPGRNFGDRRGAERQGSYWPPTVLTPDNSSMPLGRRKVGGPILPIPVAAAPRE